jgi:hypothetical protein
MTQTFGLQNEKTECPFPGRVPWAVMAKAFGLQTMVLRRPHPYRPARGRRKSRDSHHPAADTATSFIAPRADANGVIHTSPWATPRVHPPPKQIGALKARLITCPSPASSWPAREAQKRVVALQWNRRKAGGRSHGQARWSATTRGGWSEPGWGSIEGERSWR